MSATAGSVIFASTVDGGSSASVGGSSVTFDGNVGGSTPLASVDVTTPRDGSTSLPGSVTTTGSQTFDTPIQLLASSTLTSNDSQAITFDWTIDGAFGLTADMGE